MKLADTPAPARAAGTTRPGGPVPPGGGEPAGQPAQAGTAFTAAVAAFHTGRDVVAGTREDLEFEDWPAPRRLAPHAVALAITAYRDGVEAGTGKLVLLHDPAGQDGWTGTFRVVGQVHAEVEEEMAADPLLGEVGWSWLTDALAQHAPGYESASGTVTRVITEGYGAKENEPVSTGLELRASWCPADDEIAGTVVAWCDLLTTVAGLPAAGTRELSARRKRSPGPGGAGGPGGPGGPGGAGGPEETSHGQEPGGRRRR